MLSSFNLDDPWWRLLIADLEQKDEASDLFLEAVESARGTAARALLRKFVGGGERRSEEMVNDLGSPGQGLSTS